MVEAILPDSVLKTTGEVDEQPLTAALAAIDALYGIESAHLVESGRSRVRECPAVLG